MKGKITFREPTTEERSLGFVSTDDLLESANSALREEGVEVWLALDRLDVAFADTPNVEEGALRALFRAYIDMMPFSYITPKIFLRDDIWQRITAAGFREASHITGGLTIEWSENALLNLLMRRAVGNPALCEYFGVKPEEVLADLDSQRALFYRIFPAQVDVGDRKSTTLNWILRRTQDGTRKNAPRELLHLVEEARKQQLGLLGRGEEKLDGENLVSASAIRAGLPEVSKIRLEQTIYAEFPDLRTAISALEAQKTEQSLESLTNLWKTTPEEARSMAERLVTVGLFEKTTAGGHESFWVPFLYRDALHMVQGRSS